MGGGYRGRLAQRPGQWSRLADMPMDGLALLLQAGVAIGIALLAAHTFPAYGPVFLTVAIGTTIIFEIVRPAFTHYAIHKAIMKKTPPL